MAGVSANLKASVAKLGAAGVPPADWVTTLDDGGALRSRASAMAVRPNGNVVVAGDTATNAPAFKTLIAELDADGDPTTAFGPNGSRIDDLRAGATTQELPNDVLVRADGKLLVSILDFTENQQYYDDSSVRRFGTDGGLDTTYGTSGAFRFGAGRPNADIAGLEALPDGTTLVVGYALSGIGVLSIRGRLTPDGKPAAGEPAAGRPGLVETVDDFAALPGGYVAVVGGRTVPPSGVDPFSARLEPDGGLDAQWAAFGATPGVSLLSGGTVNRATAVLKQGNRLITAHGDTTVPVVGSDAPVTLTAQSLNGPPTASLTANPDPVAAGGRITLVAGGSTDPDGPGSLVYEFDFGNDGSVDLRGVNPSAEYTVPSSAAGRRADAVTVVDEFGARSRAVVGYSVGAAPTRPAGCLVAGYPLRGGSRGELLTGTEAADVLLGGGGNDLLRGLDGDDCLFGGTGNDRLDGGEDDDVLRGDSGGDVLAGAAGNDRLSGGTGNDRLAGGSGDDRLGGGSGNDRLGGGRGADALTGGSGADRLTGGTGGDRFSGGSGGDRISARDRARDRIACGSGRDRVTADRRDRVARDCERVSRR